MKFSNTIIRRSKKPKYQFEFDAANSCELKLAKNNSKIRVLYDTVSIDDEVCFSKVSYLTGINDEYLGILDAFIELMHNRPIEAIDRFPSKELDYYLRDESSIAAMSGFDERFYEILAIGEDLKKSYFKIVKDHTPKLKIDFLKMSVSEQLEFIEELCSFYFYNGDSEFESLEIVDIDDHHLIFSKRDNRDVDLRVLKSFLSEKLSLNVEVSLES